MTKNARPFWIILSATATLFTLSVWLRPVSLDLTAQRLYTLSEGSKAVLARLASPVTLKLYYSKTAAAKGPEGIRPFNNHFYYVKEVLELFARQSKNRVRLEVVDPRPDTPEEEEATLEGLKRFQLTETESYFFGLVAKNEEGARKSIEFFNPEDEATLEYELAKLLSSLTQGNKKRLAILGGQGGGEQYFERALEELYLITRPAASDEEFKEVDLLLVNGAKDFSEANQKALDAFLANGGKAIVLADPLKLGVPGEDELKGLEKFFAAWGVRIPSGNLVGDPALAGVARVNSFAPAQRLLPIFQCQGECLARSKEVTLKGLGQVVFLYPGEVRREREVKELSFTPLITTTKTGGTYQDQGFGINNPELLRQSFRAQNAELPVAARLTGVFPRTFQSSNAPKEPKSASVVLIADQDFLRNEYAFRQTFLGVSPANDNLNLLFNTLDQLGGSEELLSIRSKGPYKRPFTLVEEILFKADQETLGKVAQINASLSKFQSELSSLASGASRENLGLIQSEGLKRQRELQLEIARLKRELREAKRAGRESVERLGSLLYLVNILAVPLLLTGTYLWSKRQRKSHSRQGVVYENRHATHGA